MLIEPKNNWPSIISVCHVVLKDQKLSWHYRPEDGDDMEYYVGDAIQII